MKKKYVIEIGGEVIIDESEIITVHAEDENKARAAAIDEFCNDMKNSYSLKSTVINSVQIKKVEEIEPMWLYADYSYSCSVCYKENDFRTPYCPHCGRKMKNGVAM